MGNAINNHHLHLFPKVLAKRLGTVPGALPAAVLAWSSAPCPLPTSPCTQCHPEHSVTCLSTTAHARVPHAFSEQVLAVSHQHHRLMRVSALSQPERGGELCKEG